jgi:hypothetical protein
MDNITISEKRYKKMVKKLSKEKMGNSNAMYGTYSLVNFYSGFPEKEFNVLKTGFLNLKDASDARIASGDIIVHSKDGKVVTNKSWLFDWEKEEINSYAHKKILDTLEGFKIRR